MMDYLTKFIKLTNKILLLIYVPIGLLIAAFGIFGNYIGAFNLELTLIILIFALMILFFAGTITKLDKIEKRIK